MAGIAIEGTKLSTVGLGRDEVELVVPHELWIPDGTRLLEAIVSYVADSGRQLRSGETFDYGYWLVRFDRAGRRRLRVTEYSPDLGAVVDGASLSLLHWRTQHEVCDRIKAPFSPPRPDQMVAVSAGVYQAGTVQGVRYRAPTHMTGWYLTTPTYNGDVATLQVEHMHHVTAARPELAPLIALPAGYRFDTTTRGDAWFDQSVLDEG